MSIKSYWIIQINAVMLVMGFMFMHSVAGFFIGDVLRSVSLAYRILQLLLSFYVIFVCHKDLRLQRRQSFFLFFVVLMLLYSLRMLIDMVNGPFTLRVSNSAFIENIYTTIVSLFFTTYSLIVSRKYLDLHYIVRIVFWGGTVIIASVAWSILRGGFVIQDERVQFGRAFGVLQLVQMCSVINLAAIHLFINDKKRRVFYLIGIIFATLIGLSTGARGGVISLVLALGIYLIASNRKHRLLLILSVILVFIVYLNIVPILIWIGDYFPIFSERMLETVVGKYTGGRDPLYEQAISLINENPLMGYSYRLNADETGYTTHSGILDIALALGYPICIMFLYFFYIKGLFMALSKMVNKDLMFATTMTVFSLVASISSSSITNASFNFSMCLMAAVYYNQLYSVKLNKFRCGRKQI